MWLWWKIIVVVGHSSRTSTSTLRLHLVQTVSRVPIERPSVCDGTSAATPRRVDEDLNVLWVGEGTGSYGALLASTVARDGYWVIQAPRATAYASVRARARKADPLDAAAITAASLPPALTKLRIPRQTRGAQASLLRLGGQASIPKGSPVPSRRYRVAVTAGHHHSRTSLGGAMR